MYITILQLYNITFYYIIISYYVRQSSYYSLINILLLQIEDFIRKNNPHQKRTDKLGVTVTQSPAMMVVVAGREPKKVRI